MRAAPIQEGFNAGELSPRMSGRPSSDRYRGGCYRLENFIPDIAGPAVKRGGTVYVQAVKNQANRTWLVRFELSPSEAYILEFGDLYIRFYTNRARLGAPYEIVSPYALADLTNADGGFAISYVQSGDIIYMACAGYAPRKLSRFAATNWTITEYDPTGGPFKDVNITTTTVYASAATGAGITLTASAAIFTADHVGTLFYLEQKTVNDVKAWEVGKAVLVADVRRSQGKNYEAVNAATTGTITPIHTEGAVYDGDNGVQWTFLDPGYGWVRITAIGGGGTTATATVLSRLPGGAVGAPNASTKWAHGAWSAAEGYPDSVAFYLDRLCWGRDGLVYMSVAGDYENMQAREFGQQLTGSAIILPIPSRRGNRILWLETIEAGLVVGTGADEWLVSPASRNEPMGPLNVAANPIGKVGSRQITPVSMFDAVVHVQRSGRKMRDLRYVIGEGASGSDISALSDHMAGQGFVSVAYQAEPYSMIWAATVDGALIGAVYYPELEVLGWARFPLDGAVECVQTIPSPDGRVDDLWMIVRRTISGTTARYVEYMRAPLTDIEAQEDAHYVDSGVIYDGASTVTITGLAHLNGKTAAVLADGGTHPPRVVTGGQITLQEAASVVHVGLPYVAKLATMDLEAGAANGTAQGKIKRVIKGVVRLLRTLGGRAGPSEAKLDELMFREPSTPMGQATPLFTGDKEVTWPGGSERNARLWFVHADSDGLGIPAPATVCAFMPTVVTED
jgi:hypothetical protein